MTALVVGLLTWAAVWLAARPRPRPPQPSVTKVVVRDDDWVRRGRRVWPALAALGVLTLLPGWVGLVLAAPAAAVAHHLVSTAEPVASRREREEVERDLPAVVLLLATALRGGADLDSAARLVCTALPGATAARLGVACDRLALGVDPGQVWEQLGSEPAMAPLGRALARAHRTGAPVSATVARLADDLAAEARAGVEDRARTVGVRAAVPLGVCLLPSFLLLGIVPLVGSLLTDLEL